MWNFGCASVNILTELRFRYVTGTFYPELSLSGRQSVGGGEGWGPQMDRRTPQSAVVWNAEPLAPKDELHRLVKQDPAWTIIKQDNHGSSFHPAFPPIRIIYGTFSSPGAQYFLHCNRLNIGFKEASGIHGPFASNNSLTFTFGTKFFAQYLNLPVQRSASYSIRLRIIQFQPLPNRNASN